MLPFAPAKFPADPGTRLTMPFSLAPPTRALAALFLLLSTALPVTTSAAVLDRIIAVVNDGVVLQSDLDREIEFAQAQIRSRGIAAPDPSVLRSQVLEKLILTRVQTQRAQQAGIRVDDRELNEVLTGIAQQNKMNLQQFAEALRSDGQDYLAIREQIRDEVVVTRLRQREVDSRVNVTDQDIDLFLAGQTEEDETEYRLSHMLVSIPDGASPEQREKAQIKANGLLERVRKGEDFAALAVSNSDGQQALQGGDLDWRKSDALPLIFLQAARKLKTGESSPVIETAGGYHIIKLVDQRGGEKRRTIDETHARHILIQANALRTEDQARVQAREIFDQIIKGGDFAKLASEHSDDPGSKSSGGDLDWQPPGTFVPEFQAALDALKPGETGAPVRTQFGWHVAQVLDRRTRDITVEARRARARGAIQNRKAAEEYDTWLRRLRSEAYVEMRGPDGKALAPISEPAASASDDKS